MREALGTPSCEAVVIRTYPNPPSKRGRSWSGSNPPYLDPKAAAWLAAEGVLHLLIDLPSVDPEEDGGALPMAEINRFPDGANVDIRGSTKEFYRRACADAGRNSRGALRTHPVNWLTGREWKWPFWSM